MPAAQPERPARSDAMRSGLRLLHGKPCLLLLLAVWAPPWWSPCAFRWYRMAAISTRCRWTRTRRRCTGGADEQFEGNSTNSRARSVRFSPGPGRRARLRSMADSTWPRCQHGMAATEERRVGRAGVWCDVLTLTMCTEPYTNTSPLTLTAQIRRAGGRYFAMCRRDRRCGC